MAKYSCDIKSTFLKVLLYSLSTFSMEVCVLNSIAQSPSNSAFNCVYQYSVPVGDRQAFLWIPPDCKHVRGVIISLFNLLERRWLEDPIIRKTASDECLAIIWVGPGRNTELTADMKPGAGEALVRMLNDLAGESGYSEIKIAPIIAMGHSANGQFSWNV